MVQCQREKDFEDDLTDLFDMADQNVLRMITIEEDKQFLILMAQWEKERRGSMAGVDTVLARKEA